MPLHLLTSTMFIEGNAQLLFSVGVTLSIPYKTYSSISRV